MKTNFNICVYAIIFVIMTIGFFSCEKIEPDYRDQWTGTYDFTTISAVGYWELGFGWSFVYDTMNFVGTIEKYDEEKLKITFKPHATEPDFTDIVYPLKINGLIYPRISKFNKLDYPEFRCDNGGFSGSITEDKINIQYQQSAGHFGNENHKIEGIKINK